ncbi:MAG TPA: Hpt domain-containing protein [Acidiferrobacterales bacterium]|nr:Hpt domain-containing protein [Acidiferrobacterales bacterium]
MSTLSKIDPSTLGWVKAEIDETLKQARLALEAYTENTADESKLRFCATYLHQVLGTLQMVELDGAALLARETEALAESVLSGKLAPDAAVIETLIRGILTLPDYLARLQFGQPDAPLRFLPLLNELRALRGAEPLNQLDLFQPDLDVRAPQIENAAPRLTEGDYAVATRSLRPAFQAILLNWLRDTGNRRHLDELSSLIERLQQQAPQSLIEQLFWVSRGYLDALASGAVAINNDRKRLLARLEQQLKKIAIGSDRSLLRNTSEALVKSMLFEVGQAHSATRHAAEVRRAFALDALLPVGEEDFGVPTPEAMQSVAEALSKEIEQAQDLLSTYFENGDPATLEPLITLLHRMSAALEMLNVEVLKALVDEIAGLCQQLQRGELERSESLSLPMAGALLLLESSTRDIKTPGLSWKKHVDETIAGLRQLRAGEPGGDTAGIEISDATLSDSEFKQLVAAVGGEIRINLGKIEEALETFAAAPDQTGLLDAVPQSLNQIQGALQILGQDRAADLVVNANRHVQNMRDGRMAADNAILDALAVAVGTVGAYIEGLERDRPNLEALLISAHNDLATALTGKRPDSGNPEALLNGIETNLTAWSADHADRAALSGMQQNLRDIAWLAGSQQQERLGKLCEQMISLLDMVDSGEVPDQVEATLRQSYDALAALARSQLRPQELAKAPPRASSKDKADAVVATAPAAPVRNAAIEVEGDDDIIQIFIEDAREMIALINKMLPDWHADVSNRDALLDLRRAFHTLKGSGRMVGASEIAEFGWSMENMLNKVREGKVAPSEAMFDLLYRVRDVLPEMVVQLEGGPAPDADVALLRGMADALADNRPVDAAGLTAPVPPRAPVETPAPVAAPSAASAEAIEELPQLDATLLQIFSNETRGHTENVRSEIEKCRASEIGCQVSEGLVRAAHTLQGSARAVGLKPMAEASAEVEKLLHGYQAHQHPLDEPVSALFDRLVSAVELLIDTLSRGETRTSGLLGEFASVAQGARELQARMTGVEAAAATATARAPVAATPKPASVSAPAPAASANETIEEDLDPELLEIFLEEATDIMAAIEESLTKWRSNRADKASVAELKRQLHTLKGGARMAGAMTMGNLGHHAESLLGEAESGRVDADSELMDLLDEVHDALVTMIGQMQNHRPVSVFAATSARVLARLGHAPAPAPIAAAAIVEEAVLPQAAENPPLRALTASDAPATVESGPNDAGIVRRADGEDAAEGAGTDRRGQVRVRTALLNELVNYAGEVSISRSRMEQQIFGLRENLAELNRNTTRFRDQIRDLEIQSESQILARAQEVASQLGEDFDPLELDRFTTLQTLSRSLAESLHDLFTIRSNLENYASQAETVLIQQARINTELQEGLMRTRMISFATQGARLRHIVRQTARELGKHVELELVGAEVEVDRTVLDRMIGPFEHMIRNALDHGLESETERKRAGKPATGHIRIQASHEGSEIVIRFADDGAGLDIAAIRRKAIERGLMNSSTNLSDDELIQFILIAGFSTAGTVTQLSGRGVGMDVVHNEVKQLGGSITVDTRRGVGTTFIIRLPLTLSISQALMVRVSEQLYAIPLSSVVNILEVPIEQLNSIQMGRRPLLNWQDQVYPFMHLAVRLGIPPLPPSGRKVPVLLGRSGGRQVAIQVDGLAGTREVVIKPLGAQLAGIEGLGGATILGDGSVVLILDVPGLWLTEEGMHVVRDLQGEEMVATAVQEVAESGAAFEIEAPARRNAIVMVVDDSITVRKVTQRHLQKRGIDVLLAKDGVDAVEQLRDQVPDVMLVDIEMPRMDGYELTSRVRSDSRLKQVPIIMITSRAGEKHRDKAFALGVNEYMTKPYQEEELFARINSLLPAHLAF